MNTDAKLIKNKLGLLNLAQHLGNVSQACKLFGYSRDTFYRYKELYDGGGEEALRELSRQKPNPKNWVEPGVEAAVCQMATDNPQFGQVRASNELRKAGTLISPGGVRCVWLRNGLETFRKRLKAVEEKVAQAGIILSEAQVAALEKAKQEKYETGEIETLFPGYLGSQDTYYVGTIKGVGRIYQQTFVDTYSKVAFAKLYDRKGALVAADMLNDRVIPFYEAYGIPLLRVLTDRGTEYCGAREHHAYELFLAIEDVEHTKTKARHPQTNGICERFHQTIQNEFYAVAFRKKLYGSIGEIQADLDDWVIGYNEHRSHSGKVCEGRTPLETWIAGVPIAQMHVLENLYEKAVPLPSADQAEAGNAGEQPARNSQPDWNGQRGDVFPLSEEPFQEGDA